jgi:hypothetical protein
MRKICFDCYLSYDLYDSNSNYCNSVEDHLTIRQLLYLTYLHYQDVKCYCYFYYRSAKYFIQFPLSSHKTLQVASYH